MLRNLDLRNTVEDESQSKIEKISQRTQQERATSETCRWIAIPNLNRTKSRLNELISDRAV